MSILEDVKALENGREDVSFSSKIPRPVMDRIDIFQKDRIRRTSTVDSIRVASTMYLN